MNALVKKPKLKRNADYPYVLQVFLDADLRGAHNMLSQIAKKEGLDLPNLGPNQFVVFINKRRNMMKCYVHGNTIAHTKRERLELEAISKLPQSFGYDGELNYDLAVQKHLEEKLFRPKPRSVFEN